MKVNRIYNEDCLETMARMPDEFVDLTITSPPYDNLRAYNGYDFNFEHIAIELYRVTKSGGVIVWVVCDATVNGSETCSSFRQALYFKQCGFNLHDTMIWNKGSFTAVGSLKVRYAPTWEYMFVFSKGRPRVFNPIKDRKNKISGKIGGRLRLTDGSMRKMSTDGNSRNEYGQRFGIWDIPPCGGNKSGHPAPFPEQLVNDHIISWSNEGDLVYDPLAGSGTTAKMSIVNSRKYIASEISKEYCEIIEVRVNGVSNQATEVVYG